jgi:hypothetical protein
MNKKAVWTAGLISLTALVLNFQLAFAHETITVGDYEIEIGWVNEPPIVGQQNAIAVNVSDASSGGAQPVEDVSSLTVTISYGGQSKTLTLEPLGEDTPGQFMAPILPTVPGQYSVTLGGTLGDTAVDAQVEPEEVQPANTIQFPSAAPQTANVGMMNWLIYLSLLIGLIALVLGMTALRKAG